MRCALFIFRTLYLAISQVYTYWQQWKYTSSCQFSAVFCLILTLSSSCRAVLNHNDLQPTSPNKPFIKHASTKSNVPHLMPRQICLHRALIAAGKADIMKFQQTVFSPDNDTQRVFKAVRGEGRYCYQIPLLKLHTLTRSTSNDSGHQLQIFHEPLQGQYNNFFKTACVVSDCTDINAMIKVPRNNLEICFTCRCILHTWKSGYNSIHFKCIVAAHPFFFVPWRFIRFFSYTSFGQSVVLELCK